MELTLGKKLSLYVIFIALLVSLGCQEGQSNAPTSSSGVQKVTVKVKKGSDGVTTEQRNIGNRLLTDNKPGSIKHLYVISAYSGQTIIYSTVKGKVTSSGKRLSPKTVNGAPDGYGGTDSNRIKISGRDFTTDEVIQDDGTYGNSIPYVFWWDVQGRYHQHYVSGGQILHVSDQPIAVKNVIINMELTK